MADSLFDNRYRYDYIYPRGRSGETLRAVDTLENDRPVVVKRPAPNDAPPIRSGQEVSILNERKALMRLSGHPALTELLGGGQFSVGGLSHQYIVVERAEGVIVSDLVLELAARGDRLPELEMLVIVDVLLDLLELAHSHEIVHNDVDAKHLFWDRDRYRLKLIDWGNAVFLEGDEVTAQGISRQSDVFQIGELLYFIITGGKRPDIPRDAGDDFRLNFGEDSERLHSRLQTIVSRAAHPNPRLRYRSIAELRKDLSDYRMPLERERNTILGRVAERLRRELSKDELHGLLRTLEMALSMDPGYPSAREAQAEIYGRLSDLDVAADLDAARIYLESGNWSRASIVLEELRPRARGESAVLIALLLDWARLLLENSVQLAGPAVQDAIAAVFEGDADEAANILQTVNIEDPTQRALQWLLAERISAHVPEILLLRPALYRLDLALANLAVEGIAVTEARTVLAEVHASLSDLADPNSINLITLRDGYRAVVDQLTALSTLLETVQSQHQLSNRRLPLSALVRALNAAMALADNMHVLGKQATSSPRDALTALDSSRVIAPATPAWDGVAQLLDGLYALLGAYQTYIPAADGADLEGWLAQAQADLRPYTERLFDEALVEMVDGLARAAERWKAYDEAVIQGSRAGAVMAISEMIKAVSSISPTLSGWLGQLRSIVSAAQYVERHALYGALGRALADGWEHFDRGRLSDAERLGITAFGAARSEPERFAARRLRDLAQTLREWLERGGVNDLKRTQAALTTTELLYTPDEISARDHFAAQMPSTETYLRAMGKGLVELLARGNSASVRVLFANYVLLGVQEAHEDRPDDALFWREAAVRTLEEHGARHPLVHALEEFIERRRDLTIAASLLNSINGPHALPVMEQSRRALEENPQVRLLNAALYSLRELEAAVRDWSDGEFRAAGIKLENALKAVDEVEATAHVTLTSYRAWLMELIQAAADLHTGARRIMQAVEAKSNHSVDLIRTGHHTQAEVTTKLLGPAYAATLRAWRDTYEDFLAVYSDRSLRRSAKLVRFNELFRAMFIDRHPAYPLYRHWYELTEQAPEFPAPPTDEPVPRIDEIDTELEAETVSDATRDTLVSSVPEVVLAKQGASRRSLPALLVLLLVIVLIGAGALFALSSGLGGGGGETPTAAAGVAQTGSLITPAQVVESATEEVEPSPEATPTAESSPTPLAILATIAPRGTETLTPTRTPTATPSATATLTRTPTNTPLPTSTPMPTFTPTQTLPPQGLQGPQNLLALAANLEDPAWSEEAFSAASDNSFWRLGMGMPSGEGDQIIIAFDPDTLEWVYGNNAAARVARMEADLSLVTYNPPLLIDNNVYFGVLLADANNPANSAGLQIEVMQPGVIKLSQRSDDTLITISQRSDSAAGMRVRLDRSLNDGTVTVYLNNQPLGAPIPFVGADVPVMPLLYVHDGGVIVHVNSWSITLR
ncbi:MAG: hypothetical protein SNJ59_15945 [Aggregatilineales bacterium]